MIKVHRDRVPAPEEFTSRAGAAFGKLAQFVKRAAHDRAQHKLPLDESLLAAKDLHDALKTVFRGRCGFCETHLTPGQLAKAGRFRPPQRAAQVDGHVAPLHYWWLAYHWNNLYAICTECASAKGSRFPVRGRRAEYAPDGPHWPVHEDALLLDPCLDDPERDLEFLEDGTVRSSAERGQITIDCFALNRLSLVTARREHCSRVDGVGDLFLDRNQPLEWKESAFIDAVFSEVPGDWGYDALTRQQAKRHFARAQRVARQLPPSVEYVAPEVVRPYHGAIWLHRIEIENFKALSRLELQFPSPAPAPGAVHADGSVVEPSLDRPAGEPWLMLLGENAVGKSSVLRAIALALMPPSQQRRFAPDPRQWVTQGSRARSGMIRLEFTVGAQPIELHFSRRRSTVERKGEFPDVAVLGYGSTRLLPRSTGRRARPERRRLQNLFDSRAPLRDAERWLATPSDVKARDFNLMATSLKQLLSLSDEDRIARRGGSLFAKLHGRQTPIRSLSDGYQSMLALAFDMMLNLSKTTVDMEAAEGVVLLDELEVHLHPRWKIAIVGALRNLFPRVRFITTTHDPLCVQGLHKGELHVMTRQGDDHRVAIEQFDVPAGSRADQILTGAWFGVASTRDPETVAMMREHSTLLQKGARTPADDTRFASLDRELRHRIDEYVGTEDEQIALKAAADFTAERRVRTGLAGQASAQDLHEKIVAALRGGRATLPQG